MTLSFSERLWLYLSQLIQVSSSVCAFTHAAWFSNIAKIPACTLIKQHQEEKKIRVFFFLLSKALANKLWQEYWLNFIKTAYTDAILSGLKTLSIHVFNPKPRETSKAVHAHTDKGTANILPFKTWLCYTSFCSFRPYSETPIPNSSFFSFWWQTTHRDGLLWSPVLFETQCSALTHLM